MLCFDCSSSYSLSEVDQSRGGWSWTTSVASFFRSWTDLKYITVDIQNWRNEVSDSFLCLTFHFFWSWIITGLYLRFYWFSNLWGLEWLLLAQQYSGKSCSTAHHIAAQCSILQHNAAYCSTTQHRIASSRLSGHHPVPFSMGFQYWTMSRLARAWNLVLGELTYCFLIRHLADLC